MLPPRVALGSFPTPCEPAHDLGRVLGVDGLWVKRDDLIGHSWGGNKVRTIEFLLGDALQQRADTVVLSGGTSSNFAALMAVACAQHGVSVHQVSYGHPPVVVPTAMAVGQRCGTTYHFTGSLDRAAMEPAAQVVAQRLRGAGRKPYVLPRGGATPVGACGYAMAAGELSQQLAQAGIDAATVVVPVGSGGTVAGLVAGWSQAQGLAGPSVRIDLIGVSVSRPADELQPDVERTVADWARLVGRVPASRLGWELLDGRGSGFGATDTEDLALVERIERDTRFLVDTTYNGKALRWLRDHAAELAQPIVYWHTGGIFGVIDRLFTSDAAMPASRHFTQMQ